MVEIGTEPDRSCTRESKIWRLTGSGFGVTVLRSRIRSRSQFFWLSYLW